ncbi:hemerythrin domain-containing protein [Saccharopolyspora sp. NFXS83]|uniref:hemerythrin domain-containing protein n=1 Tax=Saccharopolyspora sp. NFXS83 TaxID=2993560 RepID=UPI00224B8D85|nr:hemerythrin domain-containing protein [Saccharopolyspora sp. NFXS83]MCX2729244.1 hemerythrin domain-containing protein [Saccharopolyspora sp. NFXS83]
MVQQQTAHDLIDVVVQDHRAVDRAFADYENGGLSEPQRRELVDHTITEPVRHSVAEEQHLYPAARRVLADGDEIVDHEVQEHAEAEVVMKRLESTATTDPEFDRLTRQLIGDVRHHVQDEEQDLLPRLREACSADERRELGEKILRAKEAAPTRPHPAAPDRPPANKILAPGAGMVDRLRDALSVRSR